MMQGLQPPTQKFLIIAQDPSVKLLNGKIVKAQVDVPAERLEPGPCGYRLHVIDYDTSSGVMYKPFVYQTPLNGPTQDPFVNVDDGRLLDDPRFHAQNVYAIVMRTLARFEAALGRRVGWSFQGHQLKVAPHAFQDANAFYSKRDQGLFFGYFRRGEKLVLSCLSHDVIAHETTHAILDGLRERYTDPSSPDQAAFHEGFADVVALLSVFALEEIVQAILINSLAAGNGKGGTISPPKGQCVPPSVPRKSLTVECLRASVLLGLADEMGQELSGVRGKPLRRAGELKPSPKYLTQEEFLEPHRRGEIFVAAMMNAFLAIWEKRIATLGEVSAGRLDLARVVEEGAVAADHLLTMAIRAIDYCPPVHIKFGDFLGALLTADQETCPNDSRYHYRVHLERMFQKYGITSSAQDLKHHSSIWERPKHRLVRDHVHFESLIRDPDEMFRFIWDNRKALGVKDGVYTRVLSIRPCVRMGPDGFVLHETVAEYIQMAPLMADELYKVYRIRVPVGMPGDTSVTLYGGGTLVFDEFGDLKYHIHNRIDNADLQGERIAYLWETGQLSAERAAVRRFAQIHRMRAMDRSYYMKEAWE